jgi:hypothetical protein
VDLDQQARQVALDGFPAAFDEADFCALDIAADEVDAREFLLGSLYRAGRPGRQISS